MTEEKEREQLSKTYKPRGFYLNISTAIKTEVENNKPCESVSIGPRNKHKHINLQHCSKIVLVFIARSHKCDNCGGELLCSSSDSIKSEMYA